MLRGRVKTGDQTNFTFRSLALLGCFGLIEGLKGQASVKGFQLGVAWLGAPVSTVFKNENGILR